MPTPESRLDDKASVVSSILEKAERKVHAADIRDRSRIANTVIWLYAVVVVACFVFVLGGLWFLDGCAATPAAGCFAWKEPAEFLLQVLTTTVLPIVTLVLGYYFGTAKADARDEIE